MTSAPRVVVIGGGIAGASTAFALVRSGADVLVLDSGQPGQATAAGAGIIQPWSSSVSGPVYDLYSAGAAYYPELIAALAECGVTDVGYRRSGSIVVDADDAVLAEVEQRVRVRTTDVPVVGAIERVDETGARALFPPLAHGLRALYIAGGARVDGRLLCAGLLTAARRLGARVETAEARLEAADDRCVVHTADGRIDADAAVVASGAWTDRLLAPLGRRTAVAPQRGQIAHLHLDGADTTHWPSVLPLASHYLVCFDDGRVAAGATREHGSGFDPRVTAAGVREVLTNALDVAPGLAAASLIEMRVGLRPLAEGGSPVLGPLADVPGAYVNAGFGASGLTMAPFVGATLAQLITTGRSDFDLRPFGPEQGI